MIWSHLLLAYVTLERLAELWIDRRNTRALFAYGGVEISGGHYPAIIILHTAWLIGLWVFSWDAVSKPLWLAAFLMLQPLRFWTLSTLGPRWTARIIVVPGEKLISTGPYRIMRHPNYAIVVGEIATLPLCFDLPLFALLFSIANALALTIRIRAENAALARVRHAGTI